MKFPRRKRKMNKALKIFLIILPFAISFWLISKSLSQEDPFPFILGGIFLFIGIVVLMVLKGR